MLRVRGDIKAAVRSLSRLQRRQVPFAASVALNDVAFDTRTHIITRIWPNSFPQARNRRFPAALFRVRKSHKRRLRAEVFQALDRDYVDIHVTGGTRTPKRGRHLAVPVQARATASGRIRSADLPRNLRGGFVADMRGRGPALWAPQGRSGRLRLMYVLKTAVPNRARFPFVRLGERFAATRWPLAFERAMRRALRTAR